MNHFTVRANTPNLPQFLQKQGYRVVISGKTDVSPLHNFPFEQIGKEFGQYFPIENRLDRKKETVNFIEDHFKSRPEQPLCLIIAPWVPHVPWFPNRDFDAERIKVPEYLADTKATRKALTAYYQSISEADKMLGEILKALDNTGQQNNTAVMLTSDQGAQFPSAKWTVYDKGIRVPFIVRWPAKVAKGAVTHALVSLVDLTPTLIDMAGGKPVKNLDGKSFKEVLTGKKKKHHDYIFAETSVEPHFWYNYAPARTIITAEGLHYIKNYHPGVRFITHIDKVEQNEFYFDSWIEKSSSDPKVKFLLDRYSYRPPEELFNINTDREEFKNLIDEPQYQAQSKSLRKLLDKELTRQGESEISIMEGSLPHLSDNSYTIKQKSSASELSFNRKIWNPKTLIITAYLKGIDQGGIVADYFNNFRLFAYQHQIGLKLKDGRIVKSAQLQKSEGQLIVRLEESGQLEITFNNESILSAKLEGDLTKIKGGYVTNGKIQGEELAHELQSYQGEIIDLRFNMNELSRTP